MLLFLFGFEADILEIALRQQHDLVDKIFLVESSQSHRGVGLLRSSYPQYTQKPFLDNKTIDLGEAEVYPAV